MQGNIQHSKWMRIIFALLLIIIILSFHLTQTTFADEKPTLETKYIEDDFRDESKIGFKENVIIDTDAGKVTLLTINKTFGGSDYEFGHTVKQTSDGGYIIVGATGSFGAGGKDDDGDNNSDVWLIKTDKYGVMEWNKTYGTNESDYGFSVEQTSNGGYIIVGGTRSYGNISYNDDGIKCPNIWLIKTNATGEEEWNKTFNLQGWDWGLSVQQTSDSGYIIAGVTESNIWLIKTNTSGSEQWNKTFGGSEWEFAHMVQQTSDGGYVIIGSTKSYGAGGKDDQGINCSDIWLIKTDKNGMMKWNRTFGTNQNEFGLSVVQTSDGDYILTGETWSYGTGKGDVWLIKTNASGMEQWNKTFGGGDWDYGQSAQQTSDGGYIIAGLTNSTGTGNSEIWLIKVNSTGTMQWNRTLGGSKYDYPSFHYFGEAIQQTSDGGYIIVGTTESYGAGDLDIWLIKTNASGNFQGNLISNNLLSDQNSYSIDTFNCTTIIPTGTGIKVQFSLDNLNWYNSNNNLNGWDKFSNGANSIDLSGLGWQGSNFYYKMNFTSNTENTPILRSINVTYVKESIQPTDEKEKLDIFPQIALIIALIIILLLLIFVIRIKKGKDDIGEPELSCEKLGELLEKKYADGNMTEKTYEDIRSMLDKYKDGY